MQIQFSRAREAFNFSIMGAFMSKTKQLTTPPLVQAPAIRIDGNTTIINAEKCGQTFANTNDDFIAGIANQLVQIGSQGPHADENGIAFVTAIIEGVQPRDPIETMLAAQMAAVHNATLVFARRLNHVETIPQQDSASRAFNQLARTFAAQVEALKRHRNGGNQSVTVKHVHVHEGGKPSLAMCTHGGGVVIKMSANPMHLAPRCNAHSKRTSAACKSPAKTGWSVCRMHGAGGGAPSGKANRNFKHGGYSKRTKELFVEIRVLTKTCRETMTSIAR